MELKGKHVFFISDRDRFFYLFGDALISKLSLPRESIVPVVFKSGMNPVYSPRLTGVYYVNYEDLEIDNLSEAKSLTFMSLNRWNSPIAKVLIDTNSKLLDKIYIFITDDEVDRWKKNHNANGELLEDKSLHISEDCVFVIKRVKFFIAPQPYFHKKICEVSNRDDVEFVDASIIFDVLPHEQSEKMRQICSENLEYGGNKYRVLLGTKGTTWKGVVKSLNGKAFKECSDKVQFLCFLSPEKRFFVEIFRLYKALFQRTIFDLTYLSPMSPQAYNAFLASCSHLILQDRGGASSARLFAKWGLGRIAIKEESPNYYFMKECYGVDVYGFKNLKNINKNFFENRGFDPAESSRNVCFEEERSIQALSGVYD